MVIVLNRNILPAEKDELRKFLSDRGFQVREIVGEEETIFGAVGQLSIDIREVQVLPGVDRVFPISKPYKLASREFKKEDTVIPVGPVKFGGGRISIIAGPCAVESRDQIMEIARLVKLSGAVLLRAGAYKPRSSPYSFQGLGEEGLKYLKDAGEATGLPVVSEIVSNDTADMMKEYVDVLQVGARNMQNFELLKKIGTLEKPVVLKRGLSATIEEWLMAAEYLLASGADNVILCERGIRTFETYTRNTLDISAIPVIKKLSHLPIIVDPSHATGIRGKVLPVGLAAIAAGADGLMVEVHTDPDHALSDGPQSLFPEQFEKLMRDIEALAPVVKKEMSKMPEKIVISGQPYAKNEQSAGRIDVAYQGEPGAYSEGALFRYFQHEEAAGLPCQEFRAVFSTVLEGKAEFGIIPIENSLAGSIHENYDLLLQYPDLKIAGEIKIRIEHCLIALPEAELSDITEVYSHPQGLAQSSRFLAETGNWRKVPFYDTAGSVAFIASEGKREKAAIASEEAAAVYGMKVLKAGIETNPRNYTRFVILSRTEHPAAERPNKASIVFSTPDKPGALFHAMGLLAERNLNLKKIESRPILGKPWRYMFYLDIEVPEDPDQFDQSMAELENETEDLRVLGIYKAN
jgi:3-deoxy-7-phosphoheptulonate synthase